MGEKRVRVAMIADNLDLNGISTVIMNYSMQLKNNNFKIFILAGEKVDDSYLKTCDENLKILKLPNRKKNPLGYYSVLYKSLKENKISVAHIHGNSALITPELLVCAIAKIKIRIVHGHNSTCDHKNLHRIIFPFFEKLYTMGFACSDLAGKWMFRDKQYFVIHNGFQVEDYKFDIKERSKYRKLLNIEDKFVIGHVGKFNEQKNHEFLVEVFIEVLKRKSNAILLLIGSGPKFELIEEKVKKLGIQEKVIFLGETAEVKRYYNVMDTFIFPSKYEGLGIAVLEAQINGLPCCVSDAVPKEVVLGNNIVFLSLDQKKDVWAQAIINSKKLNRELFYDNNLSRIRKYDIKYCAKELIEYYRKIIKSKSKENL